MQDGWQQEPAASMGRGWDCGRRVRCVGVAEPRHNHCAVMADFYTSRRSAVRCLHGCVASSQPLASAIGLRVLRQGGNAADAAVAVAAALNVTEPCSTGIGGDCFCLFYDAASKSVRALNGSGRAPAALTLDAVRAAGIDGAKLPADHAFTVTVPGAAAGWVDTIEKFGTMKLADVLQPAIELAEDGFPVQSVAAEHWARGTPKLKKDGNPHGGDMLMDDGEAPHAGDVMRMPHLAATFRKLAEHGRAGFYEGEVAQAIVDIVAANGGVLSLDDLKAHKSTFEDPIHVRYKDVDVWECAPSGQGIVALMALNMLDEYDLHSLGHNSVAYLHILIEALRLAFADAEKYVADPAMATVPVDTLLSKEYAKERAQAISLRKAMDDAEAGSPFASSDTVYFSVVDAQGNACSFINSNFMGFGTGLVPKGCGFTLQNRGANFVLESGHANCIAPGKRPYHTIIPAMATRNGELLSSFGVMGGFMQPQGHVQVLLNMLHFGMDAQAALDAPRFCIGSGHTGTSGGVAFEEGIPMQILDGLRELGHVVEGPVAGVHRSLFGRGQIIWRQQVRSRGRDDAESILVAGSDPRADGCAMGW
eukprot:m.298276 g.298276  ORF g.298276 m.298276 type:complete len:591 (+) comp13822_c0_seq1:47-1819(+)